LPEKKAAEGKRLTDDVVQVVIFLRRRFDLDPQVKTSVGLLRTAGLKPQVGVVGAVLAGNNSVVPLGAVKVSFLLLEQTKAVYTPRVRGEDARLRVYETLIGAKVADVACETSVGKSEKCDVKKKKGLKRTSGPVSEGDVSARDWDRLALSKRSDLLVEDVGRAIAVKSVEELEDGRSGGREGRVCRDVVVALNGSCGHGRGEGGGSGDEEGEGGEKHSSRTAGEGVASKRKW
jgi:hypothetical protein